MFDLPSDWKLATLREAAIADKSGFNDGDWIESAYITGAGIRIIQTGNIGLNQYLDKADNSKFISERSFRVLNCKYVYPKDILICRLADPIGRACAIPGAMPDSVTAVDCTIFKTNQERFNQNYILHWLNSRFNLKEAADNAAGSTRSRISRSNLGKLPIPEPPISEQTTISTILDTLDTQIRQTEAIIAKLQQVKQGLLHDLLTRGLDENGQLRPPYEQAPELYNEYGQGFFPRGWEEIKLGSMSEVVSGVTVGGSGKKGKLVSVPYLRVANVQDGYLSLSEIKEILVSCEEKNRYLLKYGDVLMNEGGDFDKLGRGAVWKGQLEECIHQNHVFRVRTHKEKLSPFYLAYWTESSFGKKYFVLSSKQSTNLASINSTQLKAYPVMVPPIEEQAEIEKRMAGINSKIKNHRFEWEKLKKQKAGLMDDLLTGRVRVNELIDQQQQAS